MLRTGRNAEETFFCWLPSSAACIAGNMKGPLKEDQQPNPAMLLYWGGGITNPNIESDYDFILRRVIVSHKKIIFLQGSTTKQALLNQASALEALGPFYKERCIHPAYS